jgi:2-keto-4-pentenoate hydratase/2-oxohepta-3-ene-1,7-dioic acid hydratase in catechol pathway
VKIAVANIHGVHTLVMAVDGQWVDLSRAYHDYQQIIDFIDGQTMHSIEEVMARGLMTPRFFGRLCDFIHKPGMLREYKLAEEPHLLRPLRPGKIISVGRNYRAFLEEQGLPIPDEPAFYGKEPSVCVGPDEPIRLRRRYGRVEHEGELAVVIAGTAQDVRPEEAASYIAGYTLVNDVTAREMQQRDMARGYPWYRAKNLATFCPMGPAVVHRDTFAWPPDVEIEVRVNGEVRQRCNTREALFSIPEILACITRYIPLEPGDIVSTGTSKGVSALEPGDIVEIEAPEIGVLRNPVVDAGE